jgi:hypothetical protein
VLVEGLEYTWWFPIIVWGGLGLLFLGFVFKALEFLGLTAEDHRREGDIAMRGAIRTNGARRTAELHDKAEAHYTIADRMDAEE